LAWFVHLMLGVSNFWAQINEKEVG
jgi:hypothetical protein